MNSILSHFLSPARNSIAAICFFAAMIIFSGCTTYPPIVMETDPNPSQTLSQKKRVVIGTVTKTWRQGHIHWYQFYYPANPGCYKYTQHVEFSIDQVLRGKIATNAMKFTQTALPVGFSQSPPIGLFLLDEGDIVKIGFDRDFFGNPTRPIMIFQGVKAK